MRIFSPLHGFPAGNKIFKDISTLDKTSLSGTIFFRKDINQSESQDFSKNLIRNIEKCNWPPIFNEGLVTIFREKFNDALINFKA